ncbi:MAG: winged helix-turn-helix domain-containing protein [Erythrobacter sp.]|uniref:winged helix-turn-helix domain-containing tetratricopeptide repeat protein n=1 Tax=Erythrobacter sp. TaxID=1042 RepID=UPI0032EB1EE9
MNEQLGRSKALLAQQARRIDLAHHGDFALGPVRIRPSLRRIAGPGGEQMLEPKVMQVLIALADPVGTILSRDDLIERCWEGRVIGDTSINRVISLLRGALRHVAREAVTVDNVPKVGYRLLVHEPAPGGDPAPAGGGDGDIARSASASAPEPSRRGLVAGAAALVALALAAAFLWLRPFDPAPLPDLRVAMLPLEVAEGVDPLYASGLESELRAQFAQVGAIDVTSSKSARMLLSQGLSPAQIGRRLGADYVWTGDFRVEAERAVLDLSLVDVGTGKPVHRDTLLSAPDAARHLPFRSARSVSLALGRPVRENPRWKTVPTEDFKLYLLANGMLKSRDRAQVRAAREILEQVAQRNPGFADGLGSLAMAHFLLPPKNPEEIAENRAKALELAERAVAIDPDTTGALKVFGMAAEDPETALSNLRRVVELDPGDSEGWYWRTILERRFLLDGGVPLDSARRLLEIDPLWPAAWQGPALAAEFGDMELAEAMEKQILAASVTRSQRLLVEARLARFEGDFSKFYRLTRQAASTNTATERMFSQTLLDRASRILLDLPPPEDAYLPLPGAPQAIMRKLNREQLVERRQLAAEGLTGAAAWDDRTFISVIMPVYLANGMGAALLADYDARFASHADYLAYARQGSEPEKAVGEMSPYLVLALREAGREHEARQHLATFEKAVARMREIDRPWIDCALMEIKLAALTDDRAKAIEHVRELETFGWPYTLARVNPNAINLIRGDPLYAPIRDLPEVRTVLGPIRRRLETERREVLDLGI